MAEIPFQDRTFFVPGSHLEGNGPDDLSIRMLTVNTLSQKEIGRTIFEALSASSAEEYKLAAIAFLSKFLQETRNLLPDDEERTNRLRQLLFATHERFCHFAIEDTRLVSMQMGSFIIQLFDATQNLKDPDILSRKAAIVEKLIVLHAYNYDTLCPGAAQIAQGRVHDLIARLSDADPNFFDHPAHTMGVFGRSSYAIKTYEA